MSNILQFQKQEDMIDTLRLRLEMLEKSGGGGDNGSMEPRVAKLEAASEYIQRDISDIKTDIKAMRSEIAAIRTTDFRLLFGAIIAVALGLAGVMAKGFGWL